MRPVTACIFIALLSFATADDSRTDESPEWINNKLKTFDTPTTGSARLDPYIRKALLRALTELEETENVSAGTDFNDFTNTGVEAPQTDEIITETLSPTTEESGIQIHSFIVNGQAAFANNTNTTPTLVEKNISILGTTAGNVEKHKSESNPTLYPFTEIFEAKETGVNLQQTRSIQSPSKFDIPIEVKTTTKAAPTNPTKPTRRTTTTTTTTTTTPRPTHNDDGENIEEVDQRDVHVYQAPLVVAFTVQQDAQGLPKKVIPLFQQSQSINPIPANKVPTNSGLARHPAIQTPTQSVAFNQIPETDYVTQQLLLQRQLEEKQKYLEEQLRLLQLQQKQQEELLRKQQLLIQQKEAKRQQPNNFEQSYHPTNTINSFQPLKTVTQNPIIAHQDTIFRPQNSQVSIQPSVLVDQQQQTSVANQQLPNREAVDFLYHLRTQQPQQFPLQENHLPQGVATYLQPNRVQVFHPGVNFNQFKPFNEQFGPKQNTRVFRQESESGNFGVNQNYNRFNSLTPLQTNNRYYVNQNRQVQYNTDADLKYLLSQTGFNGRAQEDLNIVSKVLSFNHGLNNNVSNRLPFDTRSQIRTFL